MSDEIPRILYALIPHSIKPPIKYFIVHLDLSSKNHFSSTLFVIYVRIRKGFTTVYAT